jgi:hypothetical protein
MVNRSRAVGLLTAASLSTALLCAAVPAITGGTGAVHVTDEAGSFSSSTGGTSTEHPAVDRDPAPAKAKRAPLLLQ